MVLCALALVLDAFALVLDALGLALDALGLALDTLVLALVFHGRFSLALFHQLSQEIMDEPVPPHYIMPKIAFFMGVEDPENHLMTFNAQMIIL